MKYMPKDILDAITKHGGASLPWKEMEIGVWGVHWDDNCLSLYQRYYNRDLVFFDWETGDCTLQGCVRVRDKVSLNLSRCIDSAVAWHSRPPLKNTKPPSLENLSIVEKLRVIQKLARRPSMCSWVSDQLAIAIEEMERHTDRG